MERVVASVRHVSDVVEEISASSVEQRSGIEEINKAIVQIDETTQRNAALVEEAAAAAAALQEQAAQLATVVSRFRLAGVPHRPEVTQSIRGRLWHGLPSMPQQV
jgi:methyl-accepting chemotaxis protein